MLKKMLALLAVATIPATMSGCTSCCPSLSLCPCSPCNWFNRSASACPPAPAVCCPPAPTFAAPLAATACPPPCSVCPPMASQMMPQYMTPTSGFAAAPCSSCQQGPIMAQPAYYGEVGCGYVEAGCGAPFMGTVGYGPSMPCGCDSGCSSCSGYGGGFDSGCCGADGGTSFSAPTPQVAPQPGE